MNANSLEVLKYEVHENNHVYLWCYEREVFIPSDIVSEWANWCNMLTLIYDPLNQFEKQEVQDLTIDEYLTTMFDLKAAQELANYVINNYQNIL